MADRNPNIPSERAQDVESRTQINENEANRRFAEKQAKLQHKVHKSVTRSATVQADKIAGGAEDE